MYYALVEWWKDRRTTPSPTNGRGNHYVTRCCYSARVSRQLYFVRILQDNPILCKESDLWYAMVPLINFEVVEWHYPSWVMRQFEPHQYVPQSCNTCVALHDIDLHGPFAGIDWKWDTPPEFQCGMSDDKEWWRGHQSMDQCHTTPYMV